LAARILATALFLLGLVSGSAAQTWQRLSPEGGMVVSLAAVGDEVYVGTADGHVFASKDGAQSWELRGRVGSRTDAVVTRFVGDPREEQRMLAAVWYQQAGSGGGVFESEDRGRSWKLLGMPGEAVRALEIAPSQPNEIVAGTRTGVFLSSDAGKNWERISPEGDEEIRNLDSLAIDPRDPKVIYAGTYHLPWLTRDGGKTWKAVIAGIIDDSDIMSLRIDASNPDRVYMSACSGIYRSENQGTAWVKLQGIPYAARRTQVIAQDPASPKTLYAGTTEGLWVTRDGGESWTRTTSREWVVNSVLVLGGKGGASGRVVLGTEAGIQTSDDAGVNFAETNRGFTHVIVRKLLADDGSPDHLLMIVERSDTEVLESRDDGKSWSSLSLAAAQEHGKATTLNADEIQDAFASPWGWMLRFANGQFWSWDQSRKSWKEWKLALPLPAVASKGPVPGNKRRASAQGARPAAPVGFIAFSGKDALVSTSEGTPRCGESGACVRMKAFARGAQARALALSASGREIALVVDGKLGWSVDGGETASWRDLPVATERVSLVDIAGANPEAVIYLGTNEGVFVSHAAESSWTKVEGGLPAGGVEKWLRRPGLWGVSERAGGLYVSNDNGATWKRVDQDEERGRFTGLVATADGAVLAGSQSEGLLRMEWKP
jgi:photosystem II stability/assembly factor-like uncharacterized protein